jgi:hypothetical protein
MNEKKMDEKRGNIINQRFPKGKIGILCLITVALIIASPLSLALSASFDTATSGRASPPAEAEQSYTAYAESGSDPDTSSGSGVDPAPAPDFTALETAIGEAEKAKEDVRPSTDGADIAKDKLWAPQSAFNSLNASIKEAKNLLENAAAPQTDVDAQTAAMTAATKTFNDARKYGTKPDGGAEPKEVVKALYLKMDEVGSDRKQHLVGEDSYSKYKTLSITVKGKTIQLNGYYTTNRSDGATYETADTGSPLGSITLNWKSSDEEIATISPNGLITPISDGDVTITATVAEEIKYEGDAPEKSVEIKISGQTAEYVSAVTIIDKDGNSLSSKEDAVTVVEGKNQFFDFYALITWHNPKTGKDRVEDTREDEVTSTIKWLIGGSSVVATINEDTGRLKSTEFSGACYVQCSVTGGNGGETVKDTARVRVDTGESGYKPAESLTLKVVYQMFPDEIVQEHTYSLADLAGRLPPYTGSYTVLGGARYGVIRASGYLFKDVVALEGIRIEDVYQFRFSTADGYNNPVTYQYLYGSGARYYFPNWDIGSSRAGASVVPPILAYESNMIWGQSYPDLDEPLDTGTRFRLVFGPLWGGDTNSSYQIYNIQGITIMLTGAPPAENEAPNTQKEEKEERKQKEEEEKKEKDKAIVNAAEEKQEPAILQNWAGESGGGSEGGGNSGSGSEGRGTGGNGGEDSNPVTGEGGSASGLQKDDQAAASDEDTDPSASGIIPFTSKNKFKIFEMISNTDTNVAPLNMDLPYIGAAIPIACSGIAAGGLSFLIGFRRRLF